MEREVVEYADRLARQYYDPETFAHALRVADYVREQPLIDDAMRDDCIALALMHDLWEDTDCPRGILADRAHLRACLLLLTRSGGIPYMTYIRNIRAHAADMPEACWVKLADMKDHLALTETLTDRLKEKYLQALPCLL